MADPRRSTCSGTITPDQAEQQQQQQDTTAAAASIASVVSTHTRTTTTTTTNAAEGVLVVPDIIDDKNTTTHNINNKNSNDHQKNKNAAEITMKLFACSPILQNCLDLLSFLQQKDQQLGGYIQQQTINKQKKTMKEQQDATVSSTATNHQNMNDLNTSSIPTKNSKDDADNENPEEEDEENEKLGLLASGTSHQEDHHPENIRVTKNYRMVPDEIDDVELMEYYTWDEIQVMLTTIRHTFCRTEEEEEDDDDNNHQKIAASKPNNNNNSSDNNTILIYTPMDYGYWIRSLFQFILQKHINPSNPIHQSARQLLVLFNLKFRAIESDWIQLLQQQQQGEEQQLLPPKMISSSVDMVVDAIPSGSSYVGSSRTTTNTKNIIRGSFEIDMDHDEENPTSHYDDDEQEEDGTANSDMKGLLANGSNNNNDDVHSNRNNPDKLGSIGCGCGQQQQPMERIGNCIIVFPHWFHQTGWGMIGPHWFGPPCVMALLFFASYYYIQMSIEHEQYYSTLICIVLCGHTLYQLINCAYRDPGIVPMMITKSSEEGGGQPISNIPRDYRYCDICNNYQPPHGAHCPDCNVCIAGFDHHCVWMGTCIGRKNFKPFLRFNLSWLLYLIFCILWINILSPLLRMGQSQHSN